jgi:hypothetical protein
MTEERRHYSRIAFHAPASLVFTDSTVAVVVVDLSLKGALIRVPEGTPIEHGAPCTLHVFLNETELHHQISLEARVAHVNEAYVGLLCVMIDLDSVTHLRRLVELNLGDPNLLERELSALVSE